MFLSTLLVCKYSVNPQIVQVAEGTYQVSPFPLHTQVMRKKRQEGSKTKKKKKERRE